MLATVNFSKTFDFVFTSFLSTCLLLEFLASMDLILSDRRACVLLRNHKSRSFIVRGDFLQESVFGPVLFFLMTNLYACVSCSYTEDLMRRPRKERQSEHRCLPFTPGKCKTIFL